MLGNKVKFVSSSQRLDRLRNTLFTYHELYIRVRVANKIFIALVATTSFLTFCAAISPPTPFSRACVRKRKPDTGSAPSYVVNNDPPMPLIASSPRKRHKRDRRRRSIRVAPLLITPPPPPPPPPPPIPFSVSAINIDARKYLIASTRLSSNLASSLFCYHVSYLAPASRAYIRESVISIQRSTRIIYIEKIAPK